MISETAPSAGMCRARTMVVFVESAAPLNSLTCSAQGRHRSHDETNKFGLARRIGLAENPMQVRLDRREADVEFVRDLLRRLTVGHAGQHPHLRGRQSV